MFAIMMTSAVGAAISLALGLGLRRASRLAAADRHDHLTVASALALLMPLLVLVVPAPIRLDLPSRFVRHALLEDSIAQGTIAPASTPASNDAAAADPRSAKGAARSSGTSSLSVDPATIALSAWALGTLLCVVRLARAGWLAARVRRRARPWRANDVVVSSEAQVPMVVGLMQPVIVLPEDAPGWSEEDLALTLLHERAHVMRRDVPKQWVASLVCALYWWNPLAWIVARTMASDREHAVDGVVLAGGACASSYASLLLRVTVRAEESGLFTPFHTPAVGRADITRRIEAVLAPPRARASVARRSVGIVAILIGGIAVAFSRGGSGAVPPAQAAVLPHDRFPTASNPTSKHVTPSATLLERALGGTSTLDPTKQLATEEVLDAWISEDESVVRVHALAMELPSGRVVAAGGRDRATGPTIGLERAYPPGSTIKPIVVAAALDAHAIGKDEIFDGEGGTRVLTTCSGEKHTVTDATPQGRMSLAKMLAVSSNIGAMKVGERLGAPEMVNAFDRAGLFLPLDGVAVAPPSRPVLDGDEIHDGTFSIGNGFSANPLRVIAAYGAIAGNGEVVSPRLRADATGPTTSRFVAPESARAVLRMLEDVVSADGTGAQARVGNLRIAGKTGTADLGGGMFYATFVGAFPVEAPRYVVLVGAETRTGSGPRTAAPRFAALVRRAFR